MMRIQHGSHRSLLLTLSFLLPRARWHGVLASSPPELRTVRAHVVHRHGDRTPITPLRDEAYWAGMLVPPEVVERIGQSTRVRRDVSANTHAAAGRGPFGRLTELGLLQMVQVGSTLRERFVTDQSHARTDGSTQVIAGMGPVEPSDLQVYCTNFERTIQSVQGLLVGLFPEPPSSITIDARHTDWMIPDPQPRQTSEQAQLERTLSTRPHILQREQDLRPLAIRVTQALQHLLAPDAHEISFGVDEVDAGQQEIELQPLGWNQLAEITKCLAVRERLPDGVTVEDVERIGSYAAWRWFQNLTDQRLVYLAMNKMSQTIVEQLADQKSKRLTIWSAHDSTLIGLLCSFRLQKPAAWPEYASSIVIELIEAVEDGKDAQYYVRFSLNGEQLNCEWEGEEVMDMIPLNLLEKWIRRDGLSIGTTTK